MKNLLRRGLVPLLLMTTTPFVTVLAWLIATKYDGSIVRFATTVTFDRLLSEWPLPSLKSVTYLGAFATLEALLLVVLPGREFQGPVTPMGNRPSYKLNGVASFLATFGILFGVLWPLGAFDPANVWAEFGPLLSTLVWFAFAFCIFLYIKGRVAPSSADAGTSGNFLFDFYWGVELHPQFSRRLNLKQYVNCRLAMMGWAVIVACMVAAQAGDPTLGRPGTAILVSAILQLTYIFKFFVWEDGYFGSMDIMHDRFGFYICWGILAWLPGIYPVATIYLVPKAYDLPWPAAVGILALGWFAIWANYDADAQRLRVRRTEGRTTIWGRPPVLMVGHWTSGDGTPRESLLLASGWWGLARHVHYVTEILLALAWTLPAGFDNYLPYFYVTFLTILLTHRSFRDEARCAAKYGADWDAYKKKVPWRIVPGIF